MDAASLNDKPEIQKVAILLYVIGVECLEIYNTFSEVSSASMNDILVKFEAYFVPQRDITYERQRLFLLVQREGQSVDDFITELRKQLRNCDYGFQSDSVLVDQLVRGLRESRLRERFLRVPDLDIKKAVDMCRAAETSKLQAQVYFTEERSIDAIKRFKPLPEVKPRATGQANTFDNLQKDKKVKEQLKKSPVLAFFDSRIESEIVVGASPFGLGAVLQQRGKPIAFASSTLTPTQRNYAHTQIAHSEEYSTSDAIPESTTTVRPQEPVDEPASDSQSSLESSSYEPMSRSPDKGPYQTRYGRVVKPPSCYVAKF
ncbi:hypothetical protein AVEN_172949-1 [Araneus ventricosus]|uniref:Reverse transcriptase/retrotransposon-derived protein RNase H-like domain-containing protein n=1 Tax=Araneus ventricosus TaxID=182803 RepID=A0A4Y2W7S6_ARAVE|nr:hypothetical protein AVEN_172949-1 [Araneus ventricosus]